MNDHGARASGSARPKATERGDQPPNPAALLQASTKRTLELAATWLAWDGRPRVSEEGDRVYTPNKAIRRSVDHLIDHLAETQALLAGEDTEADRWHGSVITLASDWAPFTEAELVEAQQRLRRLTSTFASVLTSAGPTEWSRARGASWTLQEIVEHVASPWYAEQVGNLR
jgi:hypothetical protein